MSQESSTELKVLDVTMSLTIPVATLGGVTHPMTLSATLSEMPVGTCSSSDCIAATALATSDLFDLLTILESNNRFAVVP